MPAAGLNADIQNKSAWKPDRGVGIPEEPPIAENRCFPHDNTLTMSSDASALKNKSVIVTGTSPLPETPAITHRSLPGGASGIGLSTATHFAKAGAYVTIADVQDAAGQRAAAELAAKGCRVSYVRCDVTSWESIVAAFIHAGAFSANKTLDVAVLCAGLEGDKGSLTDQVLAAPEPSLNPAATPVAPRHLALNVNLIGLYNCAWLALYYIRLPSNVQTASTFSKSLILVSSMAGYVDMPTNSDYNASKCRFIFPVSRSS